MTGLWAKGWKRRLHPARRCGHRAACDTPTNPGRPTGVHPSQRAPGNVPQPSRYRRIRRPVTSHQSPALSPANGSAGHSPGSPRYDWKRRLQHAVPSLPPVGLAVVGGRHLRLGSDLLSSAAGRDRRRHPLRGVPGRAEDTRRYGYSHHRGGHPSRPAQDHPVRAGPLVRAMVERPCGCAFLGADTSRSWPEDGPLIRRGARSNAGGNAVYTDCCRQLGLTRLGLAWLGLAWMGLTQLGLAWMAEG
jgi:hypothetical protein